MILEPATIKNDLLDLKSQSTLSNQLANHLRALHVRSQVLLAIRLLKSRGTRQRNLLVIINQLRVNVRASTAYAQAWNLGSALNLKTQSAVTTITSLFPTLFAHP